jgi:predicted RNase H-like nuclease
MRKFLLDKHFLNFNFDAIRNKYQKKDVMDNDILDALVVLWSTKRIVNNQALYLPEKPEKLNMQIVY